MQWFIDFTLTLTAFVITQYLIDLKTENQPIGKNYKALMLDTQVRIIHDTVMQIVDIYEKTLVV